MVEAQELDVTNWQRACPECGYENGFHVSFRREASDRRGEDIAVWLICPSCSATFDIGLRVRLAEPARA
jgi:hypothetical protein